MRDGEHEERDEFYEGRNKGDGRGREEYLTLLVMADRTRILFHSPFIFSTDAVQILLEPDEYLNGEFILSLDKIDHFCQGDKLALLSSKSYP